MGSIRPLITITIILAVGVFMFKKINERPIELPHEADASLKSAPLADVPPLSMAPSQLSSDPPARWNSEPPQTAVASPLAAAPVQMPSVPAVPPLASSPAVDTAPAISPVSPPIELPANIPTAQYPGDTASTAPPVAAAPVAIEATPQPPIVPITPIAPETDRYATMATESAPLAEIQPYATQPVAIQPSAAALAAMNPLSAATPSFASTWPEIQTALERQELVAAHEMLSQWYGNPNLTPAETQQVESLLGQLAGTVVYSTEHRLEPPYTVHAGDTLQTIAQKYEVPWQLLAKINGIPAADMVRPGQQLKVVHGPFSAVVELDEKQMTLMLDGRYAGRFPVTIEAGASEGHWVLEQKLVNPTTEATGVVSASYSQAAVDRVLVLRNESPAASGATISITGGPSSPTGPTAVAPVAVRLSATDVEEVADILSVGSTVTIRK